jgi:hypothetical protein
MTYLLLDYIAMSPDKKLDWFCRHGYTQEEVNDVRALAKARYTADYVTRPGVTASSDTLSSSSSSGYCESPNEWVSATHSNWLDFSVF